MSRTDVPTEFEAMKVAGSEFSASTVVSCHCIYRNPPPTKGLDPGCAVKLAERAGIDTGCSSPTGTEETCTIATEWQAESPLPLLFDHNELSYI